MTKEDIHANIRKVLLAKCSDNRVFDAFERLVNLDFLPKAAHQNSINKGFWDDCPIGLLDLKMWIDGRYNLDKHELSAITNHLSSKLMLIVSELSEALEDLRDDNLQTTETNMGKPTGFASELADVQIRLWDLTQACGIDLQEECERKMRYNAKRERKHGKVI